MPIIRDEQVPFRFTGEIEKLVIDLKPTEAASAPPGGRPDRATDHRHQPLKIKNFDFSAGTQKKFNWSPVTPILRKALHL